MQGYEGIFFSRVYLNFKVFNDVFRSRFLMMFSVSHRSLNLKYHELTLSSRHPMSGGKQITKESTHNPAMRDFARRVDIILGYVTGRVTAT